MTIGIYMITNTVTKKVYIGSSKNIENRCYTHFADLKAGIHHSKHLQKSYDKYGREAFRENILEITDVEKLKEREQYWMDKTRCYEEAYGYNLDKTSSYNPNRFFDDETRRQNWINSIKLRQMNNKGRTGVPHDAKTKEKIGSANSGENSPNAKLTSKQVREIKWIIKRMGDHRGLSKSIADHYNVSLAIIRDIVREKTWRRVTLGDEINQTEFEKSYIYPLLLTESQVKEIKSRLDNGEIAYRLAKEYGVAPNAIYSVKSGQSWSRI